MKGERRRHRLYLFLALALGGLSAAPGIELFVNRVLRPNAEEVTWISEFVLAAGFVVISWLWVRLRETQVALTDAERQQLVIDTQLAIAARVQRSLLPTVPRPSEGISWNAAAEPADKVGGDYYDFIPLRDGRMCVVLADVSGKGMGAALFVASVRANVRAMLRALIPDATHPRVLLSNLSTALLADSDSGLYVTCIVAIVDPKERSMVYVNAGHPAGVLWNANGARGLRVGGPPAGLLADATFDEETLFFGNGDVVVLVSDGITEALDASGDAVVDAIAAQIAQADSPTPGAICTRLFAAARRGTGPSGAAGWADDRTAVVFGVVA